MNNQEMQDIGANPIRFLERYGGETFIGEFASKYSEADVVKMFDHVESMLLSGDEKAFDQAKKALSWDSTLQHKYFVDAKSDQQRLNVFTENAWYTTMQKPVNWAIDKIAEKKTDALFAGSMALLIQAAAVVATGTALPIAAGFALAVALPKAYEFYEKATNRTEWIEPLAKVLEEADKPIAMKAIAKDPHLMPLRAQEQKEMEELLKSPSYSSMSMDEKATAASSIRKKGAERLNETIEKLPSTVKVAIHRNNIDQLIDFAERFDEQYQKSLSSHADQIKAARPSQRDVAKSRLARDAAREVGRDVTFEVSYDGGSISGIAVARTIASKPVAFVEDSVIKTADVLKDSYANIKSKLSFRREPQDQNTEPSIAKRPSHVT